MPYSFACFNPFLPHFPPREENLKLIQIKSFASKSLSVKNITHFKFDHHNWWGCAPGLCPSPLKNETDAWQSFPLNSLLARRHTTTLAHHQLGID